MVTRKEKKPKRSWSADARRHTPRRWVQALTVDLERNINREAPTAAPWDKHGRDIVVAERRIAEQIADPARMQHWESLHSTFSAALKMDHHSYMQYLCTPKTRELHFVAHVAAVVYYGCRMETGEGVLAYYRLGSSLLELIVCYRGT